MLKMTRAAGAACLLSSLAFSATADARNYNVLVFDNYVAQNSSVAGALAAGGIVALNNYKVGTGLGAEDNSDYTLLAGGAIAFHNGQLAHGSAAAPIVSGNFTTPKGTKTSASTLDFAASRTFYQHLENEGAGYAPNGAAVNGAGALSLTGTSRGINVFDIAGSDFGTLNSLVLSVPVGAYALINITGNYASLDHIAFNTNGTAASNILFNFGGTALKLGHVDFVGSLLAPNAGVGFQDGTFTGQLIARSMIGDGRFNDAPIKGYGFFAEFGGPASGTATPEPGTWMMLIAGFGAIGAMLRRKLGRGAAQPSAT